MGAVALQAVVDPVPAAILVEAQFPVVALAALVPSGVMLTLPFVPAAVTLCVWADSFAAVGTPAGQEIAPCVKAPLALVGTPTGHVMVPEGVTVDVAFVPAGVPPDVEEFANVPTP